MSRVLQTRQATPGIKRRRYERLDGTRYTTIELPSTVLRGITSAKRLAEALARWHRGEKMRKTARDRLERASELLREGVKPTAIAHELGITEQRVRQMRAAIMKSEA